jgi:hypothetical protein
MTIINTDGLSFFGPWSEWFWSMLQFGIDTASLIGQYRQLRIQSRAAASDQAAALARDWNSESLHRSRLGVLLALRDGARPKAPGDAAAEVGDYFERVGWLVRSGHIDREVIYTFIGNSVRLWWALLLGNTGHLRDVQQDPTIYEHFEWLAATMAAMDQRSGVAIDYDDEAYRRKLVDVGIDRSSGAIRRAEELRAVR